MKKIFVTLGLALLLVPTMALAAEFRSSDNGLSNLAATELAKNLYSAGQSVTISGNVTGDLVAAGSTVSVSGNVESSIFAVGSSVSVKGNVGENLRVAGSDVTVSGNVGGDALVAGSNVTIPAGATIGGDLLAAAGTLTIAGDVSGNITGTASSVVISGNIAGNVKLSDVTNLTIDSNAVIAGKLTYSSPSQANIDRNAVITGGVDYQSVSSSSSTSTVNDFSSTLTLSEILGSFIFLLILIYLLPKSSRRFVETAVSNLWASLGWGFLILVVVPIASLVLLVGFTTAGVALTLLCIYIASIMAAVVMSALLIGTSLYKGLKKEKDFRIDWLTALFGVAVVAILSMVPAIGTLLITLAFLVSFGTLARMVGGFIENNRK